MPISQGKQHVLVLVAPEHVKAILQERALPGETPGVTVARVAGELGMTPRQLFRYKRDG